MRSLGKVVTWRLTVTTSNFIAGWVASGNWKVGLGVAGIALVINSVLYYLHERVWNRIDAGKQINNQSS
jgi:uncharacterized membrane protein